MAQLPPKIPIAVTQDHNHQHLNHNIHQWPDFNQQEGHQNPSWVDEFMEFSTAKRVAHRRTVSDPSLMAIETEAAGVQQPHVDHEQFDKLDDEQLMSMFSTNELGSGSNPSSTSDHNSTNECQKGVATRVEDMQERDGEVKQREEKEKAEEVESTCKGNGEKQGQDGKSGSGVNKGGGVGGTVVGAGDNVVGGDGCGDQQPVVDPKRIKRILANRQSAQRSRVRKLQYISELERSVTSLQSEVSVLSPRVAFLDHQRMILNVDNSALKAKIAALAQDKIFKDAQQDALKREIERLRQVYYQQSLKKAEGNITPQPSSSPLPSPAFQPPQSDQIKDNESEQFIT